MANSEPSTFRYFAYGSNMSSVRLLTRIPSARSMGIAQVRGYRLVFDKISKKDGSGKADCERTDDADSVVFGVLFQIDMQHKQALDAAEGRGLGYESVDVDVTTADGIVLATTYLATRKNPELRPYSWYLHHVLTGAAEFDLPRAYVEKIAVVESDVDPNREREELELDIYSRTKAS
ncbi:MAG: gamma-glutamylcyclotransferase family protein [Pseudomonadota bacterium]